jgi:predicted thioredoxin/glutaredoxin
MLPKRLTMLMLSAVLALTTVAFTAPVATADSGHPNIVIQAVISMEDIEAASSYYKKANLSVELFKDIRHWVEEHKTPPKFVTTLACVPQYDAWLLETRGVARAGFRYFRSKATNFQEYPSVDRAEARVRQWLLYDRLKGRQADAQKALLNCVFDNMPKNMRMLLF